MNIVRYKAHVPPLIRKSAIPINIVVNPHNNTVKTFTNNIDIKRTQAPAAVQPNAAVSKKSIPNPAKPNEIRFPKPRELKYVTEDPSPDNLPKILNLRNRGKGKILVVLGNGPSLSEVDVQKIKYNDKIDTLTINTPDPRIWPTTFWSFYDPSIHKRHGNLVDSYDGTIFNSTSIGLYRGKNMKFKNVIGKAFSKDVAKGLCIGRSSCYAAMQIGLYMEYDKIIFLGVDMNEDGVDGKLHFYGTNPDVKPEVRASRFKDEAEYFNYAAETLSDEEKDRFYFCSGYNKWGFVRRFNFMHHDKAVDFILSCI